MFLVNQLSDEKEPFATCLLSTGCMTTNGIEHRVLEDNGHSDILLRYMENALQRHQISLEVLQRHMNLIASLKIENLSIHRSAYPQNSTTQKGKDNNKLIALLRQLMLFAVSFSKTSES